MHTTSVLAVLALAGSAFGQFSLSNYSHTATYALPAVAASEASAVTYNWDTGSLFVLGDEGDALVEVDTMGNQLSVMSLTGFGDTEGLTYIGGGEFVLAEERLQDLYKLTYSAGGSVDRGSLPGASIGPTIGNTGIEGVSYDPRNGRYVMVKEKSPQAVYDTVAAFALPVGPDINPSGLFDPAGLGVADLSDVQVLATVPSLLGTASEDNLLIYSQESRLLMEVTRAGAVLSSFDFSAIAGDAEGVTIDAAGNIYIVGETPAMYVLTVPTPGSLALFGAAGLMASRRRR